MLMFFKWFYYVQSWRKQMIQKHAELRLATAASSLPKFTLKTVYAKWTGNTEKMLAQRN